MRTNIVIDDDLMTQAVKASASRTKREAVERGLRLLVQLHRQSGVRRLRGALTWEGDLEKSRIDK